MNADGTDAHEIFAPPGGAALPGSEAWAPDGRHLVVFVGQDAWIVAADGSTQRLIFQPATSPPWASEGIESIAWAPKSDALALSVGTNAGRGPGIYKDCFDWYALTFDRSGNRLARIDSALNLAWSPDGRRLALESGLFSLEPDQVGVEVVSADGSHRRSVTAHVRSRASSRPSGLRPTTTRSMTSASSRASLSSSPFGGTGSSQRSCCALKTTPALT